MPSKVMHATRSILYLVAEGEGKKARAHISARGLTAHCGVPRNFTLRLTQTRDAPLDAGDYPICAACKTSCRKGGRKDWLELR